MTTKIDEVLARLDDICRELESHCIGANVERDTIFHEAAALIREFRQRVKDLEAANSRLQNDRIRELDACPYCTKHDGGGISPCVLHSGCGEAKVEKLPDGMFRFMCPVCGVASGAVRNLQKELADAQQPGEAAEPVAWRREWSGDATDYAPTYVEGKEKPNYRELWEPLYVAPPSTQTAVQAAIERCADMMRELREDQERLDALQYMTKGYGTGWILRQSSTGRGMRLHETTRAGASKDVRAAIDAARSKDAKP